jgi:hypothetical protein
LALFMAGQVVAVHLVADLTGPYLAEATGGSLTEPRNAAWATGVSAAAAALVGAVAIRRIPPLRDRIGAIPTLLGVALVPVALLAAMAGATSLWLLPLLATRGLPTAAVAVIAPAVVGRYVARQHRATFLSFASLSGRLAYGTVLLGLGATDRSLNANLSIATGIAVALWLVSAGLQRLAVDGGELASDSATLGARQHQHLHVHWGSHEHHHLTVSGRYWGIHRHQHSHGEHRHGQNPHHSGSGT